MKRTLMILMLGWTISSHGQLKKLYDREAEYQHFSGVILAKNADSIVLNECYGSIDGKQSIELETRFDVGSITKQFTAAAILHLVEEEKFKLHDKINPLLGSNASDRWDKVTVHQLLTHTSGVPSLYQTEQGLEIFFPEKGEIPLSDLISRFKDGKLLFSPGEEFSYSNSGYILLAAIIEQVTGVSYEEYMLEMFKKYGMESTSFARDSKSAIPFYGYRNDLLKEAPVYHMSWLIGAGGVYSSVQDLSKWISVINSDQFLSKDLRKIYLKSHTNSGYGYGWQFDGDLIQHDGGNAGFISFLSFDPKTKAHVIVLTNRSFEDIRMFGKSADYVRGLVAKSWDAMEGKEIEVLPEIKLGDLKEGAFGIDGKEVSLQKRDTMITVRASDTYPTRLIYNTPLSGDNELDQKMIEIARFLKKGKYWSLARHCDGEMKFVMYSGLMSVGMRMMKKQVGEMQEMIPFYADEDHGLIRMKGDEGILDLIVYFDLEGRIQGIFENGNFDSDQEVEMMAYPIGNSLYYLDGLPYGEKSATLKITESGLTFYQLNRSVVANRK